MTRLLRDARAANPEPSASPRSTRRSTAVTAENLFEALSADQLTELAEVEQVLEPGVLDDFENVHDVVGSEVYVTNQCDAGAN